MDWVQTLQSDSTARTIRYAVSAGLVLIPIAYGWATHRRSRMGVRACVVAFTLMAAVSGAAFVRFGAHPWIGGYNSHEVFHYYLGPKYQTEVGYEHLYPCAVVADLEDEQLFRRVKRIRDVNTQRQFLREHAYAGAASCVNRFSAERWHEFKSDVTAIVSDNNNRDNLLTDLGFVATPFWTSWAAPLVQRIDAQSDDQLAWLCAIDYLLLLLAIGFIWRTFGWTPAMVTACLVFTSFAIAQWTIRGSILRMDWLVALVAAICCLKAGHFKTAGAFAAFSILVRGFPVLFFLGIGAQALVGFFRRREVTHSHRVFIGSTISFAVLFALPSLIQPGGFARWQEYISRMTQHSELVRVRRVGVTAAATYGGESSRDDFVTAQKKTGREAWSAEKEEKLAAIKPYFRALTVAALAVIGWLSLKLPMEATAGLGVLALYFTADVSWYYYVVLWVPCLIFSGGLNRWAGIFGVAILGAGNFLSMWIEREVSFDIRCYAFISWLMAGVLVVSGVLMVLLYRQTAVEDSLARSV